ncbi:MAG: hypothetical protein RXR31_01345 [Thermoproteota archaeon]|jgi:hypothetical protein
MAFVIEQAIALVLPFIIGLLIGYILKQAFKILAALVVLVLILLFVGYIKPGTISYILNKAFNYGSQAFTAAQAISSMIPFSSILFIIGVAIGFFLSK